MVARKASLQHKVLLGYMILIMAVCGMVSILLYERSRMREIKTETSEIRRIRHDISTAHRYITELATYGESVIVWEDTDFREYRRKRLQTDSLLQILKVSCGTFVLPKQIDSLCHLLEAKEVHLLRIMETITRQGEADSLLANRLPVVIREAVRTRTVTQKKKGIAGWFGGKRSVQVFEPSKGLQDLNDKLIAMQEERERRIDIYTDSLRTQNKALNRKLQILITHLDGQAQAAFISREEKITEAGDFSFKLFALVIVSASSLLFISFLIIRHDIRKEREGRAQLQRINRENEELLGMRKQIILTISHDIRGPLGNISNCVELASETREKKKREGYLENIRHSCRHILNLVNNLMDVYKINETKDTHNEVPFRLNNWLDNISKEYARKAGARALLFEHRHKNVGDITVRGDADKLEQILDNLLTNAIKFTLSGMIRFHTEYMAGRLYVEVGDTGIGMDEETLERVFRPFERAAQEINSEGFGLGLFITKALVKVLDGSIEVESRPGKGTTFRLSFPLSETTEEPETEELPVQSATILPKHVLVVDDDSILLKITEDMLGRNGVECTTCQNAKEAILALNRLDYDLVLTDIQMPVTDGFGLLRLLRNSDIGNSRTVPVAVMTARGDGDSGVYMKSGFCGCIHKPFSSKGLLAFISSVTEGRSAGMSPFDYSRLMESTDDRRHMFGLVAKESEKDLAELEEALRKTDREAMRRIVHRMAPVWELLGANDVLSGYRMLLHDRISSDETVREYTMRIMKQIRLLIDEVNNELRKKMMGMKKTLLIVEDNLILCDILERWLQKAGYGVLTAIDEPSARRKIKGNNVALVLTDVRLPEGDGISLLEWSISQGLHIPFVVMTEHASIADAVRAVKLGAKDYLPKPVHEELLMELLRGLIGLPVSVPPKKSLMKRLSGAVRETERIACRVAPLNCSVMILGPNGSGKESVAQLIQQHSGRKDKPFVAVNCGCIRGELAASEFFGHVQGAFTDAKKDTAGYFETAKGGTLFLDEIGNMPPEMQTLLLRVLQERVYCPVGSRKELEADVRILSATNEDMERAIREGRFREDLYYRLAEFEIRQPSLSECPEDILPLADFFREQHSEEIRVETSGFTEQAKISMLSHSWPGNVRELDNRIRRAVLLAVSPLLTHKDLNLNATICRTGEKCKKGLMEEAEEKELIRKILEECGGKISRVARMLGMSRPTLYKKMERYGLR